MVQNKVKLVIWDLDDTFWLGTLEEGGVTRIDRNIEIVRELARRGIVSSICSKNNFERTKQKLLELEIWDHFVFPAISFNPKGKAVREVIEAAALRPGNVLFIDDNNINLEEVKFFNPGIMAAHPADILHVLLDSPNAAGKPDPGLQRLKQYQFLQRKSEERSASSLSNEEFLRESNIRIKIDYDIESNFDRVIELINRTNQLNYTKKRLETSEAVEQFRQALDGFGYHAGCVWAADNYGDYGLIGFYLLRRRAGIRKLEHFVFSCRTMHMGIEQYVYELLERPDIEIIEPVSYGLDTYADVDWIRVDDGKEGSSASVKSRQLLLLGGCDLLQLASYCSRNRVEFVNRAEGTITVRYDDPGFVLSDREAIRQCSAIRKIPCWSYEDALRFDEALASSEIILVSLWSGMNGRYMEASDGVRIRFTKKDHKKLNKERGKWLARRFKDVDLSNEEKKSLILRSLDTFSGRASCEAKIFLLSCCTLRLELDVQLKRRTEYNAMCKAYCEKHPDRFIFIDVDQIVPRDSIIGNGHFTRNGYFAIAKHILSIAGEAEQISADAGPARNAHSYATA